MNAPHAARLWLVARECALIVDYQPLTYEFAEIAHVFATPMTAAVATRIAEVMAEFRTVNRLAFFGVNLWKRVNNFLMSHHMIKTAPARSARAQKIYNRNYEVRNHLHYVILREGFAHARNDRKVMSFVIIMKWLENPYEVRNRGEASYARKASDDRSECTQKYTNKAERSLTQQNEAYTQFSEVKPRRSEQDKEPADFAKGVYTDVNDRAKT